MRSMKEQDPEVYHLIEHEKERQRNVLNMIPSENYVTEAVLTACGSVLNNKYSEGYPKGRYYQGHEFIDDVELLAIERAKKLFGAEHVNVQPYSGSPANMAVYHALLKPGDKIMGMRLDMGGHLTHGHNVNFSARYFTSTQYTVDPETELLDLDAIRRQAIKEKPKIIVSGATAYPRIIDFKAFHEIAEEIGAYSLADISHVSGLIAGKVHPSPFPFTDVVMTTTHKTLRGPRAAMLMCKKEDRLAKTEGMDEKQAAQEKDLARKIDRAVFPGLQGGPHDHIIAAKAVCFKEALQPEFKVYAHQIVKNAKALAEELLAQGLRLVTGGTDNHLILIDLTPKGIGLGKEGAIALENAGMCTNMNTVPYDKSTPFRPSGIRIGTPILTTRGMKESEMKQIGAWMGQILGDMKNTDLQQRVRQDVKTLCDQFPFY
ncbi:serine hydroxymethyltransferase [Candidatus Woesearchaeota archaeon]|nr:serine hydroxymethyltransferase [Candidatus Woesearchaeota archaeon]